MSALKDLDHDLRMGNLSTVSPSGKLPPFS